VNVYQQAQSYAFQSYKPIASPHSTKNRSFRNKITVMSMSTKTKKKKDEFPPVPHVSDEHPLNLVPQWLNKERTKVITLPNILEPRSGGDCVYYWMQRDMRTEDNWALLYANYLAEEQNVPLKVLYVLPPPVPSGSGGGGNSVAVVDAAHADGQEEDWMTPKVCEMKMVSASVHWNLR
jgi:hypothetical protein